MFKVLCEVRAFSVNENGGKAKFILTPNPRLMVTHFKRFAEEEFATLFPREPSFLCERVEDVDGFALSERAVIGDVLQTGAKVILIAQPVSKAEIALVAVDLARLVPIMENFQSRFVKTLTTAYRSEELAVFRRVPASLEGLVAACSCADPTVQDDLGQLLTEMADRCNSNFWQLLEEGGQALLFALLRLSRSTHRQCREAAITILSKFCLEDSARTANAVLATNLLSILQEVSLSAAEAEAESQFGSPHTSDAVSTLSEAVQRLAINAFCKLSSTPSSHLLADQLRLNDNSSHVESAHIKNKKKAVHPEPPMKPGDTHLTTLLQMAFKGNSIEVREWAVKNVVEKLQDRNWAAYLLAEPKPFAIWFALLTHPPMSETVSLHLDTTLEIVSNLITSEAVRLLHGNGCLQHVISVASQMKKLLPKSAQRQNVMRIVNLLLEHGYGVLSPQFYLQLSKSSELPLQIPALKYLAKHCRSTNERTIDELVHICDSHLMQFITLMGKPNSELYTPATEIIALLSLREPKSRLVDQGVLDSLLNLLRSDVFTIESRRLAAKALANICTSKESIRNRVLLELSVLMKQWQHQSWTDPIIDVYIQMIVNPFHKPLSDSNSDVPSEPSSRLSTAKSTSRSPYAQF